MVHTIETKNMPKTQKDSTEPDPFKKLGLYEDYDGVTFLVKIEDLLKELDHEQFFRLCLIPFIEKTFT